MASRIVFCWIRKPGLVPDSTSYHVPHSSTYSPTFFAGSYLSMIAACLLTISSILSVFFSVMIQSASLNCSAGPLFFVSKLPEGRV